MGTGMKLALGGAAATVAVAAWWLMEPAAPAAAPVQVARRDVPAPVVADAGAKTAPTEAPAPERREVATAPTATPLAIIRGRCVDEQGLPAVGIQVVLTGSPQQAAVESGRGSLSWSNPPKQTSGTDGSFEFRFAPPLAFSFDLRVGDMGHAGGHGSWPRIDPTQVVDVGDVPILQPLVEQPSVRVVDTEGQPVAGGHVWLQWTPPAGFHSPMQIDSGGGGTTDADGRCRFRYLLPGSCKVGVNGRHVVRGEMLTLAHDSPAVELEVVVNPITASDVLAGVVVDENGAPVTGITVHGTVGTTGSIFDASTDRDGAFRMLRQASYGQGNVRLFVGGLDGFEPFRSEGEFAWGRTDLRLVLRRGLELEVLATDPAGRPVEHYRLWVVPDQMAGTHADGSEMRSEGSHPGGRSRVASLPRGDWFVVVQPTDLGLQSSSGIPVHIGDSAARVVVPLQPAVQRRVRVLRRDGSPLGGASVRLIDPIGNSPCIPSKAVPLSYWINATSNGRQSQSFGYSILLQEYATDERGEVLLHGPGNRLLVVAATAPSACPSQQDQVRLDIAEPLTITLGEGARLTGTAQPEILRALRVAAGLPATGPVLGDGQRGLPGVLLVRGEDGKRELFPAGRTAAFDDDGHFQVEHVPPGRWIVDLQTPHDGDPLNPRWEDVTTVDLRDGESTDIALDLQPIQPCELRGTVYGNDQPFDGTTLPTFRRLQLRVNTRDLGGKPMLSGGALDVDANGHFVWRGRAGTITLQKSEYVTAPESVVVAPGARLGQDFHLRFGTAQLTVLDADDTAVPRCILELCDTAGARWKTWTDDHGVATREVPPASYSVEAQVLRNGKFLPAVRAGEVTVAPGKTAEATLRLPRE